MKHSRLQDNIDFWSLSNEEQERFRYKEKLENTCK